MCLKTGVHDFLVPVDANKAKAAVDYLGRPVGHAADVANRVKVQAGIEADALMEKHASLLPRDCQRGLTHLQMAALAVGAYRSLLQEGAKEEYGYAGGDSLKARSVIAGSWSYANACMCWALLSIKSGLHSLGTSSYTYLARKSNDQLQRVSLRFVS